MKLRFKYQKFQADAVKATCDVFTGQINDVRKFLVDQGDNDSLLAQLETVGFGNAEIVINEAEMLKNFREVQTQQGIVQPGHRNIERLNDRPVFTIEMETGTGKTYTYIKTIYELNARYDWSKFIVVVPSIAIREGVYKTFQITAEHFAEEYGKKIRYFIYNSARLNELEQFANDANINVMIINTQAFNARGEDARRIDMKLDTFRSRRPIDVIAATRPIIIVDEPQSVLGTDKKANATRESLQKFRPLFYLNYSATHREDFNKVFRLDAVDAYQQQLVKKIAVKGITVHGGTARGGYLYLQKINTYPNKKPDVLATFDFDAKTGGGIRRKTKKLAHGDDIYEHSGEIEAYRDGYTITEINARDDGGFVDFKNGMRIHEGEVIGETNEDDIRRIQIRETIVTHLETERRLFSKGIKVLSLFFIDEVAKYKYYADEGEQKGVYAKIFEEEFAEVARHYLEDELQFAEDAKFRKYLEKFAAKEIHAGYFSVDKKGHATNSEVKRNEEDSSDVDAYDLIMKNKERLLSFDEPVRFIFSHSALREGWDNPNVFQICTLRESKSEISKQQEIGRGLRLCVDQNGVRQDAEVLGESSVHDTNILTVIANESYEVFAADLQKEFDEIIAKRPKEVTSTLFNGRTVMDQGGNKFEIGDGAASDIYAGLKAAGVVNDEHEITAAYHELSEEQKIDAIYNALDDDLKVYASGIQKILAEVYDVKKNVMFVDARKNRMQSLDPTKYTSKEFRELWAKIDGKTFYTVKFDENKLIEKCVEALDKNLRVTKMEIVVTEGFLKALGKDKLEMYRDKIGKPMATLELAGNHVHYDLVDELAKAQNDGGTSLARETIVTILQKVHSETFAKFKQNPEEFIHSAKEIINSVKAEMVAAEIAYHKMNENWQSDEIFASKKVGGEYGKDLVDTPRHHLYDKLRYDSETELKFADELEKQEAVKLFAKLPKEFHIETPMGKYNPDWAVVFDENADVKRIYFVAETKGGLDLRNIERAKIECARKHFAAINDGEYIYDVCMSYDELLKLVRD